MQVASERARAFQGLLTVAASHPKLLALVWEFLRRPSS
jgi:hypothetical protein